MGAAETRRAIEAAHAALAGLARACSPRTAPRSCASSNDLMLANADDLAAIMTAEQGKPLAESKGEIAYAASFIEWFAEEGKRVYGDTIPQNAKGRRIVVTEGADRRLRRHHALELPGRDDHPQGRAGLGRGLHRRDPPGQRRRPFSALALAVLAERAGMPPGVCNVITGPSGETGKELTSQPAGAQADLHRLAPMSARSCWRSARPPSRRPRWSWAATRPSSCSTTPTWTRRCRARWRRKYRNTGQTCVCANRILVQDGVYDAFAAKLKAAVEAMKVGNGMEPGVTPGPADQRRRGGQGRGAHRRRHEARRQGGDRRQAPRAGRQFLRADGAGQRAARRDDLPRGDLRPGRAAVPLQDRGGGDPARQRHRVRPRGVFLRPRRRPHLPRGGGARIRHHRHQRGHHLHRGGAVRRHEVSPAWAARDPTTASRTTWRSSTSRIGGIGT